MSATKKALLTFETTGVFLNFDTKREQGLQKHTFIMHIASRTTFIPWGGLVIVLTNEMSCSFRVFRAATAAFKAGRAMFNCSSHSSCKEKDFFFSLLSMRNMEKLKKNFSTRKKFRFVSPNKPGILRNHLSVSK